MYSLQPMVSAQIKARHLVKGLPKMPASAQMSRVRIDPNVWLDTAEGRSIMREALEKLDESERQLDQKRRPWHYEAARAIFLELPRITEKCEFDAAFAIWEIANIIKANR